MSSRTVSVVLTAQVANYLTNMRAAEAQTAALEKSTRSATQQFAAHNKAVQQLGVGMLAVGATAAAGLALAVKASTDFGAKMAQLQSLSHANAATMKQLSDAAMTVGAAYGFSASQVADAQIELVKAGVSVQAQLGGALKGALTLAAAGQMDVGQATEIATVAMTQFGLQASQVPHLADLLSAGADKALGSVADLGEGLKNGGLQAHNMGLSIDDTVGVLSAFANQGILGAEAGTQLRSMFLRLQNPTAASKKVMSEYGIAINDASGKFVGITKFAGELHDKLGDLTQAQRNSALATMFGSHAIVGATALYQYGSKGIGDWISSVNDAGFASAQAAGKLNSLQGDTQKLAAAFQTDLIKAGSGANDVLRGLTQTATGTLGVIGAIPQPVLSVGIGLTALVAGVGLVGGTALIAVPKIVAFRGALQDLNISARSAAGTIGKGGLFATAIAAGISGLAAAGQQGQATAQQISLSAASIRKEWSGVDNLFSQPLGTTQGGLLGALNAESGFSSDASITKWFDGMTLGISHLSDVYKTNEGTFDAMGQQLAGLSQQNYGSAANAFSQLVAKYHLSADQTQSLLNLMPAYRDELIKQADAAKVTATDHNLLQLAQGKGSVSQRVLAASTAAANAAAQKQSDTLASLAGQASGATTSIDDLQKTIEGFGSAQLDARSATRAMYQAIDDATAAVKKNGAGLDVTTQKGRDNQAALDGIATAADQAASKILKQTGSTAKAQAALQTGRDAYIKAAEAMGLGSTQAAKLADKIGLIPKNITTAVSVSGVDSALTTAEALRQKLNALVNGVWTVDLRFAQTGSPNTSGLSSTVAARRAAGGSIDGPGPKGVDSVHALLAPGEHVLTAREVDALGGQGGTYAFRRSLTAGLPRYADGGAVGSAESQIAADERALTAANRDLAAANRAKAAAAKQAQTASDRAARIYGKGTAAAKHYASLESRAAAQKSSAASKKAAAAQKKAAAAQKSLTDMKAKLVTMQQSSEDFVSTQTRATDANPIDPLSYVDQLRSMSRDTSTYSTARRAAFDASATKYEASLVKLQTAASAAATTLTDLKNSSDQMRQSITSSIAGGYTLAGAATPSTATTTSGWVYRNGMAFQTTSTATAGPTASSIAGYYQAGAANAQQFAQTLSALAGRGLNSQLLAELAGMGTDQGLPIAQAILSGSAADLSSINSGYSAIASAAGVAGQTVADANYAAQIAAADANAQQITDAITAQGDALRKVIADAFGLKGYATGTSSAAPGIRWVGENGPELVGFAGGESVLTAPDSRRWVRGAASAGGAGGGSQRLVVEFPQQLALHDADGTFRGMVRTEARGVASQVVTERHEDIAVRLMGASV